MNFAPDSKPGFRIEATFQNWGSAVRFAETLRSLVDGSCISTQIIERKNPGVFYVALATEGCDITSLFSGSEQQQPTSKIPLFGLQRDEKGG